MPARQDDPLEQLSAELTALKQQPETAWLKEADSQALQQALKDLHRAFRNFFEKRARYPRFKSRKRDPAVPHPAAGQGRRRQGLHPQGRQVRIRQSQPVEEPTKGATFRRGAGRWFVTLTAEFEMPDVALPPPDLAVAGLDLGLKTSPPHGQDPIPPRSSTARAKGSSARRNEGSPAARMGASGRPRPS